MNVPALILAVVAAVVFAYATPPHIRPVRFNLIAFGLCLVTVAWILASCLDGTQVRF